jgi:DNA-directed RNA polymerase subunit RPC12/RpoP
MMSGAAPGKCADCGADAYIQLAVGDAMLCAHCYQDRLALTKKVRGRSVGDSVIPKRISTQPRPS